MKLLNLLALSALFFSCSSSTKKSTSYDQMYGEDYKTAKVKTKKQLIAEVNQLIDSADISAKEKSHFNKLFHTNSDKIQALEISNRKMMEMLLTHGFDYSVPKIRGVVKKMKANANKVTDLKFEVLGGLRVLIKDKIKKHKKKQAQLKSLQYEFYNRAGNRF